MAGLTPGDHLSKWDMNRHVDYSEATIYRAMDRCSAGPISATLRRYYAYAHAQCVLRAG